MASLSTSFNSSKLKLTHTNIRSCRNKEVEISLFLKDNDIGILTLNETWLKNSFKLDVLDIPLYARKDQVGKGVELISLCVMILNSISLTRDPIEILIMKPSLFV